MCSRMSSGGAGRRLRAGSGYGSIGPLYWGVAKWFKAPAFEAGTRWFESSRPSLV